jgi:hypothetical protein
MFAEPLEHLPGVFTNALGLLRSGHLVGMLHRRASRVSFASRLNGKHVSSQLSHCRVFQETEGTANAAVIARLWSAESWRM